MRDITRSQPEDFFLFFPTFTGVGDVEGELACIRGVSTVGLPLRSVEGVDVMPLSFVGAGDETTPLERVGTPFIPFKCV
jgi:hypothetical protein